MDTIAIDTTKFQNMTHHQLKEIEQRLCTLRKDRMKTHITPVKKQHLKPLDDKYIKPLKTQYIKPIDDTLRLVRKYIPKQKYWQFNNVIYGPMTRKEFMQMIKEVSAPPQSG